MKLSTFLLLINFVSFAATGYSQPEKVTVQLKDASIKELFSSIEHQTFYKFLYRDDAIENILVNLDETDKPLDKILNQTLEGSGLMFKIMANNLIIIAPGELLQQQRIGGTVTDVKGAPVPGANVVVTGTVLGTMTDLSGKYTIEIPQGARSLTFSFIGMKSQEIIIGASTQINVTLVESAVGLEEVVVIGYGTMKKRDVSTAISSLSSENLKDKPVSNFAQAITGNMAGVRITTTNAAPGGGSQISIRGIGSINAATSPLFVIDGFPLKDGFDKYENPLNSINRLILNQSKS
jgi:hypothetical protein